MHALDKHVGARDDEPRRVGDDRRVVATRARREVWLDAFEQTELANAFEGHAVSMARRRRTACSGSADSATARMTHTRRIPMLVRSATLRSSIPPTATTGLGWTADEMSAIPRGAMTFFLVLTGVAKA